MLGFVAERKIEKRLNEAKTGLDEQAILGVLMDIQKKENIKKQEKIASPEANLFPCNFFRRAPMQQNKDEKKLSFFSIGF